MATQETMVQRLGDGSCICDKCWAIEYPGKTEPENNWVLGQCDFCGSHVQATHTPGPRQQQIL